jgi:hypothetical protein
MFDRNLGNLMTRKFQLDPHKGQSKIISHLQHFNLNITADTSQLPVNGQISSQLSG